MNVDKVIDVIAKHCATPNTATSEKTQHLRNQPWLHQDDLIHQYAVAGLNMLGETNKSRRFTTLTPEMMVSGPKLACSAEG
jgi:hypothetical protein